MTKPLWNMHRPAEAPKETAAHLEDSPLERLIDADEAHTLDMGAEEPTEVAAVRGVD
jgi:hypothetical protein